MLCDTSPGLWELRDGWFAPDRFDLMMMCELELIGKTNIKSIRNYI